MLAVIDRGGKGRELLARDRRDDVGNRCWRVDSFNSRYGQ